MADQAVVASATCQVLKVSDRVGAAQAILNGAEYATKLYGRHGIARGSTQIQGVGTGTAIERVIASATANHVVAGVTDD